MQAERANYLAPGHNACPGCGVAVGVRLILRAAGKNVIVVSPTGCLETFTSPYGASAWEVPWVHSLFENAPAVASGIEEALKYKGDRETHVIVIGGDGATFDIGFGSLSGMFEREHDILYICNDNEGYMNTGIQRSAATPYGAATATTPRGSLSRGKPHPKKDMIEIARAHNIRYVASATLAFPQDLMKKVKKGLAVNGPAYIHLLTPCNLGWGINPEETVEMSRLMVRTGLFPVVEFENGKLTSVMKFKSMLPVENYLKRQKRFSHLFDGSNSEMLNKIQRMADGNVEKYGLKA
ncbi:MAG: thiamine pyrophosphate-dependent enzyme [Bacillota bacterium]